MVASTIQPVTREKVRVPLKIESWTPELTHSERAAPSVRNGNKVDSLPENTHESVTTSDQEHWVSLEAKTFIEASWVIHIMYADVAVRRR